MDAPTIFLLVISLLAIIVAVDARLQLRYILNELTYHAWWLESMEARKADSPDLGTLDTFGIGIENGIEAAMSSEELDTILVAQSHNNDSEENQPMLNHDEFLCGVDASGASEPKPASVALPETSATDNYLLSSGHGWAIDWYLRRHGWRVRARPKGQQAVWVNVAGVEEVESEAVRLVKEIVRMKREREREIDRGKRG